MEIKTYWVGDRPPAWFFQVRDSKTSAPVSIGGYTRIRAILVDSDNREIVFPDANALVTNEANGEVTFIWPQETVFTKAGRYVMQLELSSTTTTRRTTVQEILVKELGGVTR